MNCPHCHKEFTPEAYGLIDCPFCGKPVFNRAAPAVLAAENTPSPANADLKPEEKLAAPAVDITENTAEAVTAAEPQPEAGEVTKEAGQNVTAGPISEQHADIEMITPEWENRDKPIWKRFLLTARDAFFRPTRFFATLPDTYSMAPLHYSYILWFIYFAFTLGTQYYLLISDPAALTAALPNAEEVIKETFGGMDKLQNFMLFLWAITPFWALLPTYLLAIVLQSFLWLLRIDNMGYFHTLRVVAYSSTVLLLAFIPPIFGTAILIIPAILLIAIVAAYRINFLLALPLSLMTFIGGGALVINLMMGLTRLLAL